MTRQVKKTYLPVVLGAVALIVLSSLAARAAPEKSYLEVSPHDSEDLRALFQTIEQSQPNNETLETPIVIILHGEEANYFTRNNYLQNKSLVDRAALLDAYQKIDIRMCETWMNENGISRSDLPPFIDTIPFAPEEINRLKDAGYAPYRPAKL